jgi:hypothetical protein
MRSFLSLSEEIVCLGEELLMMSSTLTKSKTKEHTDAISNCLILLSFLAHQ